MSPLRNAGVFEALLRLSCMTCPLGVHGGRSTWKTAHRSRKSNNNAALYPEFDASAYLTRCCEPMFVHTGIILLP